MKNYEMYHLRTEYVHKIFLCFVLKNVSIIFVSLLFTILEHDSISLSLFDSYLAIPHHVLFILLISQ